MSVPNDLTVRMSPAGDGWQSVEINIRRLTAEEKVKLAETGRC